MFLHHPFIYNRANGGEGFLLLLPISADSQPDKTRQQSEDRTSRVWIFQNKLPLMFHVHIQLFRYFTSVWGFFSTMQIVCQLQKNLDVSHFFPLFLLCIIQDWICTKFSHESRTNGVYRDDTAVDSLCCYTSLTCNVSIATFILCDDREMTKSSGGNIASDT